VPQGEPEQGRHQDSNAPDGLKLLAVRGSSTMTVPARANSLISAISWTVKFRYDEVKAGKLLLLKIA